MFGVRFRTKLRNVRCSVNAELKEALLDLVNEVEELKAWQSVTVAALAALPQYAAHDMAAEFGKAKTEGKETYKRLRTLIEEASL